MDRAKPITLPSGKARTSKKPRFATVRNILALMLREMSTRYGRTPGGYIWAVVEPVAAIMFLSLGFSLLLRTPSLGTSFILFYASGYLVMHFYNSLSGPIAKSIDFSKSLLRYPAVSWIDAMMARFILNCLTGIAIAVLLLTVILSVIDVSIVFYLPPIIEAFLLAALLGVGVGALNCCLFGLFPIWEVVWSILTRPLFIASGVIFIYEDLPAFAQDILWWNPIFHLTGLARSGFYTTYSPTYIDILYVLKFSLITLALGLLLTRRYNREILNR
jgi:capsular polysaccharide transport system permease protein